MISLSISDDDLHLVPHIITTIKVSKELLPWYFSFRLYLANLSIVLENTSHEKMKLFKDCTISKTLKLKLLKQVWKQKWNLEKKFSIYKLSVKLEICAKITQTWIGLHSLKEITHFPLLYGTCHITFSKPCQQYSWVR